MFIVLLGHSIMKYLATQQPTVVLCGNDSGEGLRSCTGERGPDLRHEDPLRASEESRTMLRLGMKELKHVRDVAPPLLSLGLSFLICQMRRLDQIIS